MAAMGRRNTETFVDVELYNPQVDVDRLAQHFKQTYGSLEKALKTFDPHASFNLYEFERLLRKWDISVGNVVEFFGHIDWDFSGAISMHELFTVLEAPLHEMEQREKERWRHEVDRIYAELARCIHREGGDLHSFRKMGLQSSNPMGTDAPLSLAQFSKLVKHFGIEIDAQQLKSVFNDIDDNNSGQISYAEMNKALSFYIARERIAELADMLIERFQSWDAVEKEIDVLTAPPPAPGALPAVGLPIAPDDVPGSAQASPSAAASVPVTEENFLKVLRQLRILDQSDMFREPHARDLYKSLNSFTLQEFVKKLKKEHQANADKERRRKAEVRRREAQEKKLHEELIHINNRQRVKEHLDTWDAHDGDVTHNWASAARAGRAKSQLNDYVVELQHRLTDRQGEIETLQDEIEVLQFVNSNAGMSPRTPKTPKTPSTAAFMSPKLSDSNGTPSYEKSGSVMEVSRTVKAERLIQAAGTGDVSAVERCLDSCADVDAVAWRGVTALMAAASHGRQGVIELLLDRYADPARTDMNGHTALDHARKQPAARTQLRMVGALGSRELAEKAAALAKDLLEAEAKQKRQRAQHELLKNARTRRPALLRPSSAPDEVERAQPAEHDALHAAFARAQPLPRAQKHVTLSLPVARCH